MASDCLFEARLLVGDPLGAREAAIMNHRLRDCRLTVEETPNHMELKGLLDQPSKLPTIPKVVQQLIKSFSDDDVSINEIARQIATDPALSAKLLRLANSAYFHVSRTIGTCLLYTSRCV